MANAPLPHRPDLSEEVYIDETAQTGARYLVIGGVVIPRILSRTFQLDVMAARQPRLAITIDPKTMRPSEMGWHEISKGDFEKYKKVVDAFFSFASRYQKTSLTSVQC